jgi:biopolymer transport protein ExbD
MILLFGFVCYAELNQQEKIVLPKTVELPPMNPDPEVVVFVEIQRDGLYLFGNGEAHSVYDAQALETFIQEEKSRIVHLGHKMRVRLRANYDTPIKFVMAAVEACDKAGVLKTVDVRIGSKFKKS